MVNNHTEEWREMMHIDVYDAEYKGVTQSFLPCSFLQEHICHLHWKQWPCS